MKHFAEKSGTALVTTLLFLFVLFVLTTAGLMAATSSLQVSGNYRTGIQAVLAAETGVLHSAETLDGMGIVRMDQEAVTPWETVFGTGPKTMPGHGSIRYSVDATTVASSPLSRMTVTSTGLAPRSSVHEIEALLRLDGAFSPGAVYLPGSTVDTTFNGNSFLVDGNDHLLAGGINPDGEARPGLALRSESNVGPATSSLTGGQRNNVVGLGGYPSVLPANGPTTSRITNEISPNILSTPGVVRDPVLHGTDTFGSVMGPQITHFTGSVTLNGDVSGAGILIVDQGLTINGNLSFVGLVIVRGATHITVSGSATLTGALWSTGASLTVAGSAGITYSSEALELMNQRLGENLLPQGVAIAAWGEP